MRYTLRFLAFLLTLNFSLNSFAQNNEELESVLMYMKTAMRYSMLRPQEKVYLHLDNTGYFKGETIWFKGYVVRTDDGGPTDLSRILYVELLNPSGDVVEKRVLPIEKGIAYGDIKVDSIMTTGFYEVRAYTRYMTNWGANACFSRILPIFKAPKKEGDYSNPQLDQISYRKRLNNERAGSIDAGNENIVSIKEEGTAKDGNDKAHFYPEGGDIVKGLPSKVAFTLANDDGMPIHTNCQIVNGKGEVLYSCPTDSNGYGIFTLRGDEDNAYLQYAKNKKQSLPMVKDEGCSMLMDVLNDEMLLVDIYASPAVQGRMLGYSMVHNGKIVRCDTLTAAPHVTREFVRANLPAGVSQFTLFDSDGKILAERMFFIRPDMDGTERVKITSPTATLKPCGKVTFNVEAQPDANLSFSAVDAEGMVNGSVGNMYTWMLLSSELRGYIRHPEYYFESDDEEHRRAADLLMLVQGWRRYDWNLMSGQSTFLKFEPIEDKQYLFGRLRQKSKKNTVDNVWLDTKLYNRQGMVVDGKTKTDSLGNYVFILPEVEGEWNLSINTGKADKDGYWKDVNYYIAIDRNFSPAGRYVSPIEAAAVPVDDSKNFKWTFSDKDEEWVSITRKDHVLQNVTVKAKGRFWDRTNWGNESNARMKSLIYYNCDDYADRIADEGEEVPLFADWLKSANSFFDGDSTPTDVYIAEPDTMDESSKNSATGRKMVTESTDPPMDIPVGNIRFYADGLMYKNRPIVWVIDNQFCTVTRYNRMKNINITVNDNAVNTGIELPMDLDEVKSVYISEDLQELHSHLMCQEIESSNPVVLYCYTHRSFNYKQKGLRNTHYQGYNVPSTFQMEDYSVIPPMEDFRRTIFWVPEVKTDAYGKAVVEFWNNSSCKEMHISCEGMTSSGKILTNE